uniref:Uncharacterized protein n=1 Tax=Solanum tuberosum TaxID=4113 RepID=M1AMD4_SOLTU
MTYARRFKHDPSCSIVIHGLQLIFSEVIHNSSSTARQRTYDPLVASRSILSPFSSSHHSRLPPTARQRNDDT